MDAEYWPAEWVVTDQMYYKPLYYFAVIGFVFATISIVVAVGCLLVVLVLCCWLLSACLYSIIEYQLMLLMLLLCFTNFPS